MASDTANSILIYMKNYKKQHNKMPMLKTIKEEFGISDYILDKHLKELQDDGLLLRNSKPIIDDNFKPLPKKEEVKKEITKKEISDIKILVLRIGAIGIGAISTYMSIYYTYMWFTYLLNPIYSFLMSFAMIGFSILAFEFIIYFFKIKKVISVIFGILWVIVVLFSMISTVAGNYNKIMKSEISKIDNNNNKILYENLEKQIEENKTDLISVRAEREKLEIELSKIEYGKKDYWNINWLIGKKNERIDELKNIITDLENQKTELLKSGVDLNKVDTNFYNYLSKIFKIKSGIIQFVLSLFPALFIDISAPLCFAVAIFIKKDK